MFSIVLLLLLAGTTAAGESPTLQFQGSDISINSSLGSITYRDWPSVVTAEGYLCPARVILIELHAGEAASDLHVTRMDTARVGAVARVNTATLTADGSRYNASFLSTTVVSAEQPVYIADEISIAGRRYARLLIFPTTVTSDGTVMLHESVNLSIAGRAVAPSEAVPSNDIASAELPPAFALNASETAPQYIIVTSRQLAPALQALKKYRNETGYVTEIVCIEDILAGYIGRDEAEQLRNYLKVFYASGGKYVLLAGGETVLPIRYAYHYTNSTDTLITLDNLQICDLYFADLTGDWNRDNDQTWGERLDDAADLMAELIVGRLPFDRPEDFQTYTANLIQYETSPGNGDPSYLGRTFFYSSDQMRDLFDGQHNRIAEAYPPSIQLDTVSGVEATRGDDPAPSNLAPDRLEVVLRQGYGIINVLAHGRVDGFVLKSANYNEWPKTLMLTQPPDAGHGSFSDMVALHKPAFYYSLACDNATFDADQPPFNAQAPNFCQQLLSLPDGAAGFVGYTRWGWVGTSYILQKAYFDSLFAHPERSAAEALYAVKPVYYYYRDMCYGLNYFGDPAMRLYTSIPKTLSCASQAASNGLVVDVVSEGHPVSNCTVVVARDGAIVAKGQTDATGAVSLPVTLDSLRIYSLALIKEGYQTARSSLIGSIATDIDEQADELPLIYSLSQNYPNPFNPNTTISFELPKRSEVTLSIYNVLGQEVKSLARGEESAGRHTIIWDGTDQSGSRVAAGTYLYRLSAAGFTQTKKMVLLP